MPSDEEVLKGPVSFGVGGGEVLHVDVEEVDEAFDLFV